MKRLLSLVALLVAASACVTTTNTNTGTGNANVAANTNTAATPAAGISEADITAKEKQVWDAVKSKNTSAFGALLADDFLYVSDDGVHDKAATVTGLKDSSMTDVALSNFKMLKIDTDAAAITYDIAWSGTYEGKQQTANLRGSSAWVKRGSDWLCVYHQDTVVGESPAGEAQTANANKSAANANTTTANSNTSSANANASASPEAADPVSKEKMLWDELKRKDYDAFASDLADEAIEVEPNGRFDKAGSINGVKGVDFSKYTLSDFKEVKIDADASVVTYVVKSADGKEQERHSTVWVKRGQKWYAILHEGTPFAKK